MNHGYSLLFVLVDASLPAESGQTSTRRASSQLVCARISGNAVCMLVRAGDLQRTDAKLEEWALATAARFGELQQRYTQLTPRERQALALIASGLLRKQAAGVLGIAEATLQAHRARTMQRMAARSFADLVRIAHTLGPTPDIDTAPPRASSRTALRVMARKDAA